MSDPGLAVFRNDNLPGNPAGWPLIGGQRLMPMSGTFLVQAADGSQVQAQDGFLAVGLDGWPVWLAVKPVL